MWTLMTHPINRLDAESWAIQLRNRAVNSMGICARMLLDFQKDQSPVDHYRGVMIRIFVRTVVNRFLGNSKTDKDEHEKLQRAILYDLYDTKTTGVPLVGSHQLVSITKSHTMHLLFGTDYSRLLRELSAYAESISQSIDEFIPPQLLSAVLYRLYDNTFAQLSVAAEAFLISLVQDSTKLEFNSAFFDDRKTLDILPSLSTFHKVTTLSDHSHQAVPGFGPHLGGPFVTVCGSCGHEFLSYEEALQPVDPKYIETIKKRIANHFKPLYKNIDGVTPTPTSSHYNLHRSVLQVFYTNLEFKNETRPTRKMVIAVVSYIRNKDKRGNFYQPDLLSDIVKCVWDLLQQFHVHKRQLPELLISDFQTRLKEEINHIKENKSTFHPKPITYDGLTPEEISHLTEPLSWDTICTL